MSAEYIDPEVVDKHKEFITDLEGFLQKNLPDGQSYELGLRKPKDAVLEIKIVIKSKPYLGVVIA